MELRERMQNLQSQVDEFGSVGLRILVQKEMLAAANPQKAQILSHTPRVFPGLIQTEPYILAIVGQRNNTSGQGVTARLERGIIIREAAVPTSLLIGEVALTNIHADNLDAHRNQLEQTITLAEKNIRDESPLDLRVVPNTTLEDSYSSLTLIDTGVEGAETASFLSINDTAPESYDSANVERLEMWTRADQAALSPEESLDFFRATLARL